ncbi:MAG: DUF2000 family protein [Gemmatimonadota bacterium]
MFDTKIAIVLREDLAGWQKLNVTAFLTSGLIGSNPGLIGEGYEDANGNAYNALIVQPVIVLAATAERIARIYRRALERGVGLSLFIDDMFTTLRDADNRAAVKNHGPDSMSVAGLALRASRKVVDKVTKGARMHP